MLFFILKIVRVNILQVWYQTEKTTLNILEYVIELHCPQGAAETQPETLSVCEINSQSCSLCIYIYKYQIVTHIEWSHIQHEENNNGGQAEYLDEKSCCKCQSSVQFRGFRYLRQSDKLLFYYKATGKPSLPDLLFKTNRSSNLPHQLRMSVLLSHHSADDTF